MTDPVLPGGGSSDSGAELDPQLIAELDAIGESVLSELLEHDDVVGECTHYWSMLVVDDDEGILACVGCSKVWDTSSSQSALHAVWTSAAEAMTEIHDRLESLEQIVTSQLNVRSCARCGVFFEANDPSAGAEIGGEWSCIAHIPLICGVRRRAHPSAIDDAAVWAEEAGLVGSTDLTKVALLEQLIAAAPEVDTALGCDNAAALARPVNLRAEVAAALGCAEVVSVAELAAAFAVMLELELPLPEGRCGAGWLVALVASTDAMLVSGRATGTEFPARIWAEIYLNAQPVTFEARRTVATDLLGDVDASDLGDEYLTVLGQLAAETLLAAVNDSNVS